MRGLELFETLKVRQIESVMDSAGSRLGKDDTRLGNDWPFLLWDVVLMHVDIISIGIQIVVEH